MSMTLSIPIKQQITLPDAWQACRTPQELSYWLIAKFETFEADVEAAAAAAAEASHEAQTALVAAQAAAADATQALNAISNLDAQVVQLNARVTSLSSDLTAAEGNITALAARMATAETDIDGLDSRVGQTEFDIGQAQTDINAVGTIAQNNQREIGTDETAGTIKGRITALENAEGVKLYRHKIYFQASQTIYGQLDLILTTAEPLTLNEVATLVYPSMTYSMVLNNGFEIGSISNTTGFKCTFERVLNLDTTPTWTYVSGLSITGIRDVVSDWK